MSSHYKTKEPLSDELISKLIKRCVVPKYCYRLIYLMAIYSVAIQISDYFIFAKASLLSLICMCTLHKVNEKFHLRMYLCFYSLLSQRRRIIPRCGTHFESPFHSYRMIKSLNLARDLSAIFSPDMMPVITAICTPWCLPQICMERYSKRTL